MNDINKPIVEVLTDDMIEQLIEMPYKKYLNTRYWKEVKKRVHNTLGNDCKVCGSCENIHIHHFHYANKGKETFDDVVCLCEDCHFHLHRFLDNRLNPRVLSVKDLDKLVKAAKKISKTFNNKKYMMYLPLTRLNYMTTNQIASLWGKEIEETEIILEEETKTKLIRSFSMNNEPEKFYLLNSFIWYLLERQFPKI